MIKIIRLILSFLFLISLTYPSSAQTQPWKKLRSPVKTTLRYLCFVDSLNGWAAGESGTIIGTTDGGYSWEVQNSTVQTFIMDIFFIDINNGWALTFKDVFPFNSIILKTTNGGDEWSAEDFPDSSKFIRTIFFFDTLNGFVAGSYIGYTSDGGNSWVESDIDSNMVSSFPVYKFNFLNRQFGYACGGRLDVAGVVWRTTNYGINWTAQGISADEIFDVFVFDSLNAITLSGDPEGFYNIANLKTTDAGVTWNFGEIPFFGLSFNIDFRTFNEGWSASGYKFLFTSDRGETWSEVETPDSTVIYALRFANARYGYAVGQDGVILKLDPALVSVKDKVSLPIQFILHQNYPNPFNPSTNLQYTIGGRQFVTLKVYDVLGNEIATLVNEEKQAGSYNVEFGGTGLPSGIYFYQLKTNNKIQTKKMVYLK
jgi:photosystem II stability/assembly factor-like uncharacterized protein